mgnify:CR=1 FL=1
MQLIADQQFLDQIQAMRDKILAEMIEKIGEEKTTAGGIILTEKDGTENLNKAFKLLDQLVHKNIIPKNSALRINRYIFISKNINGDAVDAIGCFNDVNDNVVRWLICRENTRDD